MSTFAIHSNVSKEAKKRESIASIRLNFERMETCTRLRKLIAHRSFCDIYLCTVYTVQPMFLVRSNSLFRLFRCWCGFFSSSSSFWFHFICVVHLIFTPLQELTVTKICLTHQYLAYCINIEKRDSLIL